MIDVLQQQNDGRPGVGQAWSVVSVGPVLAPTLRPTARHKASAQANNEAAYAYVTRFRVSRGGGAGKSADPGRPCYLHHPTLENLEKIGNRATPAVIPSPWRRRGGAVRRVVRAHRPRCPR